MPPRPLPFRKVKRKLEAIGFTEISQRGSHVKFAARDTVSCVIANEMASPQPSGRRSSQEFPDMR